MRLNRISSVSVNAAWPAANEIADGASPATRITIGSRAHSTCGVRPDQVHEGSPDGKPERRCPTRARTTFWPVLSALERSTESVPNATQNPCCTLLSRRPAPRAQGQRHRGGCSEAIANPGRRERRHVRGPPPTDPANLAGWRPSSRSIHERRAAAAGEVGVRRDLVDDEAQLLGAEARIERARQSAWR